MLTNIQGFDQNGTPTSAFLKVNLMVAYRPDEGADKLMVERRLDPCMSEVFTWADLPDAHMKMMANEHKPGNMSVLVQSPKTGLRTLEDALDAKK